jgi:hypothetical protein
MRFWFKKQTKEQKIIKLVGLERELVVLWQFENRGNYALGMRTEIITLEKCIARLKKEIELMG